MDDRFGRYLAPWRYRGELDEDFWKRDDEKFNRNYLNGGGGRAEMTGLPSVLVSEVKRTGTGLGTGNRFTEKARAWPN
jgi:hypothetical protein